MKEKKNEPLGQMPMPFATLSISTQIIGNLQSAN